MSTATGENDVIVSYLTLRKVVGAIGMAMPLGVMAWGWALCGCWEIRPSISDYYATRTGVLFVGALFTIAWFLFAYLGPDRQDDIAGDLAWLFALGVAFFPHDAPQPQSALHFISAGALFLVLSYFSLALFTKTGGTRAQMTPQKVTRNRVYRLCGVVMLACVGTIGAIKLGYFNFTAGPIPPVFLLETLALEAFGISWMVKGETVWRD